MDAMSKPIEMKPVSTAAMAAAKDLVRTYDGDQVEYVVVDVGGVLVKSATNQSPWEVAATLQGVIAKAMDRYSPPAASDAAHQG